MSQTESGLPEVTVLMPVYNGQRYLQRQVATILAQQGVDLRLVILDDGSTDASFALATDLAAEDGRITLAERRPNAGLSAAVARLLSFVETPYFAMSDQDDLWDPDKLARSIGHLETTCAALVYSDVRLCNEHGVVTDHSYFRSRRLPALEGTDPLASIFRNPVLGHTIVARRGIAAWGRELPPTLPYYEPWLVAAACRSGGVTMIKDQLGSYRVHAGNVVGPQRRHIILNLGKAGALRHLTRRQANRSNALGATAYICPDLAPLAEAYSATGLRRVVTSLRLAKALRRRCPEVGFPHILREAVLSLVWPAPRSPVPGDVAATCQQ